MTVDAFLQMDDSTAPMNTLRYSAFAQLANSSASRSQSPYVDP